MNREEQWLLQEKYGGAMSEAFLADCERLTEGEPLSYIIGSIPFLNTTIFLDSHPLIPRPETEFWTQIALSEIKSSGVEAPKVLDLCAGSGCIGVAVLKNMDTAHVDFIDIDGAHLATIQKNCTENGIPSERFALYAGDVFETVPQLDTTYDFILTNPPYIHKEAGTVAQSVLLYEPHVALFGGEKGLDIIYKILEEAARHLHAGGVMYIEHEPEQVIAINERAALHGFEAHTHTDQFKIPRYTRLCMPK